MSRSVMIYKLMRTLMGPVFRLAFRPTIVNKEVIPKEGAIVLAGNHKHAMDPILVDVCTKRVVYNLAKKELHDGAFGWFFRAIGSIPVDLKAKENKQALQTAISYLEQGTAINVSPEAKRNYTKELLLPFKYGAVVMAKRTNTKIIPYAITGAYKFRSKDLKITFGEPMDFSDMTVEEANVALFERIKTLLLENR